jgi:hypothetical protein
MKDITISSNRIKKELISLLVCFLISFASNIGAIIYYKSPASEVLTSLLYVLVFTGVLYVVWSVVRILTVLLMKLIKK